jgi:hypothetical protein
LIQFDLIDGLLSLGKMNRRVDMSPAMLGRGKILRRIVIAPIGHPLGYGCTFERLGRNPVDRFLRKIVREVDPRAGRERVRPLRTACWDKAEK